MAASDLRDEATAAYAARKELGPDYEQEVLESFAARAAASIDERVDARLTELQVRGTPHRLSQQNDKQQQPDNSYLAVPFFSLVFGFGTTIWLAAIGADPGFAFVMWVGTAIINVSNFRNRRTK